jgi:DNA polymerase delta subunit 1
LFQVVAPKKGFYSDPVAVFDFASLYPSIMQNWNLSHDTLLTGPRDDIPYNKTPNGFYFVDKSYYKGTVVTILTKLLAARRRAKKQMKEETDPFDKEVYDGKQKALKIVCNTMYGKWDPN